MGDCRAVGMVAPEPRRMADMRERSPVTQTTVSRAYSAISHRGEAAVGYAPSYRLGRLAPGLASTPASAASAGVTTSTVGPESLDRRTWPVSALLSRTQRSWPGRTFLPGQRQPSRRPGRHRRRMTPAEPASASTRSPGRYRSAIPAPNGRVTRGQTAWPVTSSAPPSITADTSFKHTLTARLGVV
jgi:hypothetical protein